MSDHWMARYSRPLALVYPNHAGTFNPSVSGYGTVTTIQGAPTASGRKTQPANERASN